MYRIDNATAATVMPVRAGVGPRPNGFFTKGNPVTPIPATIVDDDWLNALQEEIVSVIAAAGIVLHKTSNHDLLDAIQFLINQIFPVTIARGGTNRSGFTNGSVIFAGATGAGGAQQLTEDPAQLFWDRINKRLGIATVAPATALDVVGNSSVRGFSYFDYPGGEFFINPDAGGNQLINFAANQFLEFLPSFGFGLNTTGGILLTAPSGVSTSAGFTAGGAISAAGPIGSIGNITANSGRLRAALGARGSGDTAAGTILNDFPLSPLTTGYTILPNGLIIQWGEATSSNGVGVTFPLAFPSACFGVVANESQGAGGTWGTGTPTIHAIGGRDRFGFTHWTLTWNGTGFIVATNTCCWIAFGV